MHAFETQDEVPSIIKGVFVARAAFVFVETLLPTQHVDPLIPLVVVSFISFCCNTAMAILDVASVAVSGGVVPCRASNGLQAIDKERSGQSHVEELKPTAKSFRRQ